MSDELVRALRDGLASVTANAETLGEQLTSLHALRTVLIYLEARGVPAAHRRPLQDLLAAVLAHADGTQEHPILAAPDRKKAVRPPIPSDILNRRAAAAGAMELLKRDGLSREKAARWVAQRIGWKMPEATWESVAGWRDDANRKKNTLIDVELFRRICSELSRSPTPKGLAVRRAEAVLSSAGLLRVSEER